MVDVSRNAIIRQVPAPDGGLHVTDCPGDEPALVLMLGFPDDCRIYNRLVPLLSPRRAVTFDFLGYGRSDRAQPRALSRADHVRQLGAVLDALGIQTAVLITLPAIRAWTTALFGDLDDQDGQARRELTALDLPVALVFGALDRYLSPDLVSHLAGLFPKEVLHLIDGASHWPQWDQPQAVSEVIRCAP